MRIYSNIDLYNKYVQEQASEAFLDKNISAEAYKNILEGYQSRLYTPNYFIRIASGALTLVAVVFSALLLGLVFQPSGSGGSIGLFFSFSVINYAALELLVRKNHYYNAGVDNLLLFFSAAFIVGTFMVKEYTYQNVAVSGVAMVVCVLLSVRFVDAFMSLLGYMALFVFVFLLYLQFGNIAKATAPFLMMIVSAVVYILMKSLVRNEKLLFYRYCCKCVMLLTLVTFYASGNYFTVKELSNEMFNLHLSLKDTIPLGWLFWIFTFVIPPAYIAYGITKKDIMLIRTGIVLIFVTVFTYRYYHAIVPVEIVMLAGGSLLILISYSLIKYLKISRYGFRFDKNKTTGKERIDLEALIIAQVTGKKPIANRGVEFGGGSFGSGGAGDNY
jgi:uncharacterized membrane protein YgcG